MLRTKTDRIVASAFDRLVHICARVHPDVLTLCGLVFNGVACAMFALSAGPSGSHPSLMRWAGVVVVLANVFDVLDGRVARLRGRETKFGAFLDSAMDRYSDMLLYLGLLLLYARLDDIPRMVLVWVAAFASFMTSYTRARAESLIPSCDVGFLERPERIILIVLGAVLNRMVAVLWVIAVLGNLTAVQRVYHVYYELKKKTLTGTNT